MSNLLDKASIILTPTAYNNGEALCVKPSDGSGDFDFSRNSAATRVNAQGLVENVQILSSNLVQNGDFSEEGVQEVSNGSFSQEGSELITNGDFSNGSTGWQNTFGGEWVISGGKATLQTGADGTYLSAVGNILTTGKSYKAVITTSGGLDANNKVTIYANSNTGKSIEADGTHTLYFTANGTVFRFSGVANDNPISIESVSVREVGQDWTLGTGWSVLDGKAVFIGSSSGQYLVQNNVYTPNSTIKLTFDVLDYVSGAVRVIGGGFYISGVWASGSISSNGTHTFYIDTSGAVNNNIYIQAISGVFNGSITNISVKEVGMDWDLGTGWSIGDDKAISNGSGFGALSSSYSNFNSKKLKVNFDILNYVSGEIRVPPSYRQDGLDIRYSANGSYELIYDSINSDFALNTVNFNGSVTNISVLEITDDTNLPRINYEGFSYQDVLGSEEIVNGGFDTNLNNWVAYSNTLISWESGGYALLDSNNNYWCKIKQSNVFEIGKTYKVILTAKSNRTDLNFHNSPITGSFSQADTFETFNQYYTATTTDFLFGYANAGSSTITIDNVSVKEYLGQEVVPNSGCGSWLFEPQSTNLITQSELFSDASWANVGLTINNNASVSPEGVFNATKIIATTANSRHELKTNLATGNGTDMVSCFVKKSGYNYVQIASWANPSNYVNFDLANGSVGSIGTTPPTNYGIKDYGNGWYRIYANVQASGGGIVGIGIVTSASSGWAQSFIGNGIDGIEIWGAQVEQQSYATSYIPTNGSTVTRNQDVCNNGGSLATINSTEGVLYAEIDFNQTGLTNGLYAISDGTFNNYLMVRFSPTNKIQVEATGGVNIIETSVRASGSYKTAVKYSSSGVELWVDGTKIIETSTQTSISGINQIMIAKSPFGNIVGCKTKALAVWKEALSDQELTELTTI